MAQILVVGLGKFGFHVARLLHEHDHEVVAVDSDVEHVQDIRDYCSKAVHLDARDKRRLEAIGLKHFDIAVVSLGEAVDVSALVALHLKEVGIPRIITKAGSEDHARLLEKLEVDEIVFPEREAADRLVRRLSNENVLDFIPLDEKSSIEEVTPPTSWVGKSLRELEVRKRFGLAVVGVRSTETGALKLNPAGDHMVLSTQSLLVLGDNADLRRIFRR